MLATAADKLKSANIAAQWKQVDIRKEDQVACLFDDFRATDDSIDILVNNAGGQFSAPASDITANGFRAVVDLNLTGTWLMSHAFARHAIARGLPGKIINIVLSIECGAPGYAHAAAARSGVINLTKTLASEWARYGLNVTSVAPGIIDTHGLANYDRATVDRTVATLPMGRMGKPNEVANCVAFLASPAGGTASPAKPYSWTAESSWRRPANNAIIESGRQQHERGERKPFDHAERSRLQRQLLSRHHLLKVMACAVVAVRVARLPHSDGGRSGI